MKSLPVLIVAAVLIASNASAQMPPVQDALDGVDPVVLIQQGKEAMGKSDLSVVRGGFRYLFSTVESKATFEREPAKYEIQLGGTCARMGKTVRGNPSDLIVHDGRIYIFGSDDCHKKFAAAPAKYLPVPPAPMPTSAAAQAKGRELLDVLVTAFGGAARLDGLTSYIETATQIQKRPQGEVKATTRTMWRFPDAARIERTNERAGAAAFSFSSVVTPAGAWGESGERRAFLPPVVRASLDTDLGRHPVVLLRARNSQGFSTASLGPTTIDGTSVEQVRVQYRSVDVTLGIDSKSKQLHSLTFSDRNQEGEYGTFTLVYTDFRNVDGLVLPHQVGALFNGQPNQFQTWSIQSIAINAPLDAALFTPPSGDGR